MIIRMLIDYLNKLRGPSRYAAGDDDINLLAAYANRGAGIWVSVGEGECCSCGHEWDSGELIGHVTQAYVKFSDGVVARCPGRRLACVSCVEEQRIKGDLSLQWARDSGVLR